MKTAVIIGGSGEIGSGIAKKLANDYQIINVHKHFQDEESSYFNICADCTNPDAIENVTRQIYLKFETIDLLVNCLGKNTPHDLEEIDLQIWKNIVEINLQSIFFLCKIFGLRMQETGAGEIINIASTAGIKPLPKSPHYIAAKAGVIALTKYFATVYAPTIRVNAIAPGYVLTSSHKNNPQYEEIIKKIPLHRMVNIEDIVDAVYFISRAQNITGQVIILDGGMTI
jgi:NAD(P)-dependent dehydrogenase (short-subunit alcohol dehydrogenase family)